MLHVSPPSIQIDITQPVRRPARPDSHLITLCRRAIDVLAEDHRRELILSDLNDSFMDVPKPKNPGAVLFPSISAKQLHDNLKRLRAVGPEMRSHWHNEMIVSGRYQQMVKDMTAYEAELLRLEREHGLLTAKQASYRANKRSRRVVAEVAGISATTSAGVAAKCKLMKACLDAGYGTDDEFEDLATSIYADGAIL